MDGVVGWVSFSCVGQEQDGYSIGSLNVNWGT